MQLYPPPRGASKNKHEGGSNTSNTDDKDESNSMKTGRGNKPHANNREGEAATRRRARTTRERQQQQEAGRQQQGENILTTRNGIGNTKHEKH